MTACKDALDLIRTAVSSGRRCWPYSDSITLKGGLAYDLIEGAGYKRHKEGIEWYILVTRN